MVKLLLCYISYLSHYLIYQKEIILFVFFNSPVPFFKMTDRYTGVLPLGVGKARRIGVATLDELRGRTSCEWVFLGYRRAPLCWLGRSTSPRVLSKNCRKKDEGNVKNIAKNITKHYDDKSEIGKIK